MKPLLELLAGWGLVALGLVGLVLPVMPGWIFLIPGLAILARHYHWARRLLAYARLKYRRVVKRRPPGVSQ